jgi:hypothetical protein
MRQRGRDGRCRPRSLGASPRDAQVPTDLFASCRTSRNARSHDGLGKVRRMSAVSCGYHEREVQPLLEFSDGVAETVVPMGRFVPAHCERRSERGEGCGGGALTYRTTRAPSCNGPLPPDASRAGSVPLCARGRPALSPRRREPPRRGGAPARSPRAGRRTAPGAAHGASSPASTVACRWTGSY